MMKKLPVFVFPISLEFYLAARHTHKQLLTLYNPCDFPVNFQGMWYVITWISERNCIRYVIVLIWIQWYTFYQFLFAGYKIVIIRIKNTKSSRQIAFLVYFRTPIQYDAYVKFPKWSLLLTYNIMPAAEGHKIGYRIPRINKY